MEGKPYARRLLELEQRFGELEPGIPDSSEKVALSVLHGMVQELSRSLRSVASPPSTNALTLNDIVDLHRSAPPMEGSAESAPLGIGTRAPDFTLPDSDGRPASLHDYDGSSSTRSTGAPPAATSSASTRPSWTSSPGTASSGWASRSTASTATARGPRSMDSRSACSPTSSRRARSPAATT